MSGHFAQHDEPDDEHGGGERQVRCERGDAKQACCQGRAAQRTEEEARAHAVLEEMGHSMVFEKEEELTEKRSPWRQGGRVFCMDMRGNDITSYQANQLIMKG